MNWINQQRLTVKENNLTIKYLDDLIKTQIKRKQALLSESKLLIEYTNSYIKECKFSIKF